MGTFFSSLATSAMRYITSIAPQYLVPRNAIENQEANPSSPVDADRPKKKKKKKKKTSEAKNVVPTAVEGGASLPLEASSGTNSPPIAQQQEYPAAPAVDPEGGEWRLVARRSRKPAPHAGSTGTAASLSLQELDIDRNHEIIYDNREEFNNFVLPKSFGAFKTAFSADHNKICNHDGETIEKWMLIANKIRGHGTDERRFLWAKENEIAKAVYSDLIHCMGLNSQKNPQIGWAYLGLAKVESSLPNQGKNTIESTGARLQGHCNAN
jgi:hypothetical protein